MKGELIYYYFDCQDCLYTAGAFYPEFPLEQRIKHKKEFNHNVGKLIIKPKGLCLFF